MHLPLFFWRVLPLIIVVAFFKGLLNSIWGQKFIDLYTSLALALVVLLKPTFLTYLALIILGFLRGFEGSYPFFLFSLYYLLLLVIYHSYFKPYFKEEKLLTLVVFWGFAIIFLILGEVFYFLNRAVLYNFTYPFWIGLVLKSILYGLLILVLSLFFYRVLRGIRSV